MTIRRGSAAGDSLTFLRRALAHDEQLSFRALGVATHVLSKPPNWTTDAVRLSRGEGREGEKAIRTALRELESRGYLRRRRRQVAAGGEKVGRKTLRGGSWVTDWELTDDPATLRESESTDRQERPFGRRPPGEGTAGEGTAGEGTAGPPPPVVKREREERNTPPTPVVVDLAEAELAEGVGGAIAGTAPMPAARSLQRECRRLAELGWRRDTIERQARAHDWTGARAGAVVAWLRDLDGPPPAHPPSVEARPAHCGDCDLGTRLLLDDQGRPRRGHPCPTCGGAS